MVDSQPAINPVHVIPNYSKIVPLLLKIAFSCLTLSDFWRPSVFCIYAVLAEANFGLLLSHTARPTSAGCSPRATFFKMVWSPKKACRITASIILGDRRLQLRGCGGLYLVRLQLRIPRIAWCRQYANFFFLLFEITGRKFFLSDLL